MQLLTWLQLEAGNVPRCRPRSDTLRWEDGKCAEKSMDRGEAFSARMKGWALHSLACRATLRPRVSVRHLAGEAWQREI